VIRAPTRPGSCLREQVTLRYTNIDQLLFEAIHSALSQHVMCSRAVQSCDVYVLRAHKQNAHRKRRSVSCVSPITHKSIIEVAPLVRGSALTAGSNWLSSKVGRRRCLFAHRVGIHSVDCPMRLSRLAWCGHWVLSPVQWSRCQAPNTELKSRRH